MPTKGQEFVTGAVRGLLTSGAWARILFWARQEEGRVVRISVRYTNSAPLWIISLYKRSGELVIEATGKTAELAVLKAVRATK